MKFDDLDQKLVCISLHGKSLDLLYGYQHGYVTEDGGGDVLYLVEHLVAV